MIRDSLQNWKESLIKCPLWLLCAVFCCSWLVIINFHVAYALNSPTKCLINNACMWSAPRCPQGANESCTDAGISVQGLARSYLAEKRSANLLSQITSPKCERNAEMISFLESASVSTWLLVDNYHFNTRLDEVKNILIQFEIAHVLYTVSLISVNLF